MLSCNAYAVGNPDAPSACTFCLSCVTTPATAMCTQCFVQGVRTSQGCEVAPSQLITKLHHSLALRGYVSSTKFADELGLVSKVNMSSQCASGVDSYQMWGNDPVANASAGLGGAAFVVPTVLDLASVVSLVQVRVHILLLFNRKLSTA